MKPLMFVLAGLLSAAFASAEPIPYKDWMTVSGPDEVFAKDACLAATNVSTGTNRTQLMLSFTKDRATVPQLLLKVWDQATPESQLLMKVSSKVSYPLFLWKASTQADQPSIYWYAPIGWSPLADYIAAANSLSIQGAATNVVVSLKGSSVSLQKTATCLKATELLPLDFLKKLNAKTEMSVATYASVDEMIAGNEKTFEVYRNGLAKTKELADLRKGSAKLLSQESEALKVFDAAQKRWEAGNTELNTQISAELQLQQTLTQATAELATQQSALPGAQDVAKIKLVAYEPVRKQYSVFVADVEAKQSALNQNIRETRNFQNRIAELEREIPSLKNELDRLRSQINSLSSDVDRARRDFDDKDREADRYNVSSELSSALSRDYQYNDKRRDADRFRQEANRYSDEARNYNIAKRASEARLRSCKDQTPPQNCTALENEVRDNENRANQAEQRARSAISNANNAQRDAEWRANSIRSDIERQKRELESEANEAERKYRSLKSDLESLESRANRISNTLPDLRNELSYCRNQLPGLQNRKPALEQALSESVQKRDTARTQLDYDRLKSEYETAANEVSAIESAIATAKKTITSSEAGLKKIKVVIENLTKELAARALKRDQAAQKLAPIQEALKPFRAQEAALMQTIADLAATYEDGKARYQRTYESWIAPSQPTVMSDMSVGTF